MNQDKNHTERCVSFKNCGGCDYQGVAYTEQLKLKQKYVNELLSEFGHVEPIIGMEEPISYRNKVHHVFTLDKNRKPVQGFYEEASHKTVQTDFCMLEDKLSQEIISGVFSLLKTFRISVYDERNESGLLRHVLVRRGFTSGEIMVVLVVTSPVFPSKNNFVKALLKAYPQITTIVLNINNKFTSMVLGKRSIPIHGPGYIYDNILNCSFRISPDSFFQVNPVQTKILYEAAISFAGLSGKEIVLDAYCGIGTIGLCAAENAKRVIGVELNPNAVKDAVHNARRNHIDNAVFIACDASEYMVQMAARKEKADVVFMDPPRSGSTEAFINAISKMAPERVVYISCGPETQKRDLKSFIKKGYKVERIQPVDMFPYTKHVETVVLLSRALALA